MQPWGEFWGMLLQVFIALGGFAVLALGLSLGFGMLLVWIRNRWDW